MAGFISCLRDARARRKSILDGPEVGRCIARCARSMGVHFLGGRGGKELPCVVSEVWISDGPVCRVSGVQQPKKALQEVLVGHRIANVKKSTDC